MTALAATAMQQQLLLPQVCGRQPGGAAEKSTQRLWMRLHSQGTVPLHSLATGLAGVLGQEDGRQALLSQCAVDRVLFGPDLRHADEAQAAVLCACCCVDPWNASSQAAACHVGNLNQARPASRPFGPTRARRRALRA